MQKIYLLAVSLALGAPMPLACMALKQDGSLLVYDKKREEQSPQFQQWLRDHQNEQFTPEYREARLLEQVKTQTPEYQAWFQAYQEAKKNNTLHIPICVPNAPCYPECSEQQWQECIKRLRSMR